MHGRMGSYKEGGGEETSCSSACAYVLVWHLLMNGVAPVWGGQQKCEECTALHCARGGGGMQHVRICAFVWAFSPWGCVENPVRVQRSSPCHSRALCVATHVMPSDCGIRGTALVCSSATIGCFHSTTTARCFLTKPSCSLELRAWTHTLKLFISFSSLFSRTLFLPAIPCSPTSRQTLMTKQPNPQHSLSFSPITCPICEYPPPCALSVCVGQFRDGHGLQRRHRAARRGAVRRSVRPRILRQGGAQGVRGRGEGGGGGETG